MLRWKWVSSFSLKSQAFADKKTKNQKRKLKWYQIRRQSTQNTAMESYFIHSLYTEFPKLADFSCLHLPVPTSVFSSVRNFGSTSHIFQCLHYIIFSEPHLILYEIKIISILPISTWSYNKTKYNICRDCLSCMWQKFNSD